MFHVLLANWQPFAAAAGFLLFLAWESGRPFARRERRLRHAARNLAVAGMNAALVAVVFAGATVAVAEYAAARRVGLLHLFSLPAAARLAGAFLLLDLWTYWWHRANHRVRFLWRFHRMHHSDPEMDVSTATRFHLGEIAFSSLLRLAVIPVVGLPIVLLIAYDMILLAATQFHHANLALAPRLDRILRWLLVSPDMHKVHHSRHQPETDSNYTSVLSVWDRIFGTYREADRNEIRLGLEEWDADKRQSVKGMILTPLART